ncbi:MAG: tRNA dihydrouridine synthase DusB [Bacteroidales bacterium]|nr:tRNA dihydrouridine synthase DusB [Bacteroidales bacterium]
MDNLITRLLNPDDTPLYLAPMEDITDPSFRFLVKKYGADVLITEFISSDELAKNIDKSFRKFTIYDYERPVGIQIYGHKLENMVNAAKIVAEAKPDFIDINWGCPVKKIAKRGAGSGMLKNIPLLLKITEAIVKAVNIPITVKTRLGWDENSIVIHKLAPELEKIGVKTLTLHARTRQQFYTGTADWSHITKIKQNPDFNIPLIGNGDIDSPQTALARIQESNVNALMIGRASIGRPWIFRDVKHYLQTGDLLTAPGTLERVNLCKLHIEKAIEWKGEGRAIREMRKQYLRYFKELPDFVEFRKKLVTENNLTEIEKTLDMINEKYNRFLYLE